MHKNGFAEGDGEGFVDGLAEGDAVGLRLSFAEGEADGTCSTGDAEHAEPVSWSRFQAHPCDRIRAQSTGPNGRP